MSKAILVTAAFSIFMGSAPALLASAGRSPEPPEPYVYFSDGTAAETSYLGVDTRDLTPEMVGPLHLKNENGVEVTMVDQDAPAGKAGIKDRDVILSINGETVESVEQLRRLIREIPPGRTITIGLSRDGQLFTVKAQLTSRSEAFSFGPGSVRLEALKTQLAAMPREIHVEIPPIPDLEGMDVPVSVVVVHSALHSGLMLENLTPQLGSYFGVKNGEGLLVRSVGKGSLAEQSGFRAGDVIVRVNGHPVSDSSDFSDTLRSRQASAVSVGIVRDHRELTLTLKLPPRDQSRVRREKFVFPEISEQMQVDMNEVRSELARIQPEIQVDVAQARQAAETAKKDLLKNREQWQKQAQQMRKQGEQMRREWQQEERKLREELHGNRLDI